MILDATTKSLRIVLGEAKTTTDCDITSSYAEGQAPNVFVPGNTNVHSNGTTPVTVVPAPSTAGRSRDVHEVRLFNADTVAHTVTLQLFDGSTAWAIGPAKVSVPANGAFVYTPGSGITVSSGGATGPASGDLSGTYPSPTVAAINGQPLGSTTAAAGNVLIGSGSQWVSHGVTGDVTLSAAGAAVVTQINGTALGSTTATSGNLLIGSGTQWVTHSVSGDITLSSAGAAVVTQINGSALGSTTPTSGNLLIGSGSQWVTHALSGDVTVTSAGVATVNAASTTFSDLVAHGSNSFTSSNVAIGGGPTMSNSTAFNVTSISLGAGEWLVFGNVGFGDNTTTYTELNAWISTTSAAFPTRPNSGAFQGFAATFAGNSIRVISAGFVRLSLGGTTTVFLSGQAAYTGGNAIAFGFIAAIPLTNRT